VPVADDRDRTGATGRINLSELPSEAASVSRFLAESQQPIPSAASTIRDGRRHLQCKCVDQRLQLDGVVLGEGCSRR
jgi:hypothetical protein